MASFPVVGIVPMKKGDLSPPLDVALIDEAGAVVNLTGCTVKFIMATSPGATPKISAAAAVVSAAAGTVRYQWITTDTDTLGTFAGEFEVTNGSAQKRTFPKKGYLAVEISQDLG